MDLTAIRVFVTVAQEGSLTRAGERMHMSQPAVSLQLRKLQEELGLELFERTSRGMRLTQAGRTLLPAARQALEAAGGFRAAAQEIRGTARGHLRIGTIVDPDFLRLGALLQRLARRHPGLSFELQHGMSGAVARSVELGNLDAAYTLDAPGFPAYRDRFTVVRLAGFAYRVVAPPGWQERVAGRGWRELAALPWVETPPESVHARLLRHVFDAAGVEPNVVARVDLEPSMLELVRSGVALSLARDSLALHARHAEGLAVADAVALDAELGFMCLAERRGEPAVDAAMRMVREVWGEG